MTAAKRKFQRADSLKLGSGKRARQSQKVCSSETAHGKMNQHHMLRRFRQQRGLQIKWIQHHRAQA
jgi:hypothetical protein